jgi:hypothetical protein
MTHFKKDEDRIQQEIVKDFRNKHCLKHHKYRCLIMHIPNEGKPQLVSIGLYPGASDLIVCYRDENNPRAEVIYFEVKTPVGIQSPKQKEFQEHVESIGFRYEIVRSIDEFYKKLRPF